MSKGKNKMRKWIKIIVVVVLIGVIGFGGYTYLKVANMKKMMSADNLPQYDYLEDVTIYTTKGEMTPTGFEPNNDPDSYSVMVEPIPTNDRTMMKFGTVQAGDGTVYELVCDEGGMGEVTQAAPNPLSYMIAGSSLNLYNQLIAISIEMDLVIDEIVVEQTISYIAEDLGQSDGVGFADVAKISILIESTEDESLIAAMTEAALASWEAGEGIANETSITSTLLVNGEHFTENYAVPGQAVSDIFTDLVISRSGSHPDPQTIDVAEDMKMSIFSDGMEFEMVSVVTSDNNPDNPYQSTARVRCTIPGYEARDITADDASLYGGVSTMPTSRHYFSAGTGFCLMTQLTAVVTGTEGAITDYRVEQQFLFDEDETLALNTYVLFNSTLSDEDNEQSFKTSLSMCYAGEELKNSTTMENAVFLNDKSIK